MRIRMTAPWLERVDPSSTAEWIDTEERGLRLRVRKGRMVWSLRYLSAGAHVRYTIGEYPAVGLAAARKESRKVQGAKASGADPQAQRRAARKAARETSRRRRLGETVAGAIATWLKDRKAGPASRWKGGLEGGSARCFLPHVNRLARDRDHGGLGDVVLTELQPKDVDQFVAAPEAASTRNHALTVARLFLAWARRKGLVDRVVAEALVVDVEREKTVERTRVLTEDELRELIHGFDAGRYGRAVRLLALTALRRDEVLAMEWSWISADGATLTIPAEAEKSGRVRGEARQLPLSRAAGDVIAAQRAALFAEGVRSEYVFATNTGARPHRDALKPTLNRLRGFRSNGEAPTSEKGKTHPPAIPDDMTIHDVRRTVANALRKRLGASPWVVDFVVLGHVRPKLLRTYMPEAAIEEARPPLEAWARELDRILAETPASEARA